MALEASVTFSPGSSVPGLNGCAVFVCVAARRASGRLPPLPKVDVPHRRSSLHVHKYPVPVGELQPVPVRLVKHFLGFAVRAGLSRDLLCWHPRSQTCPAMGAPVSGHVPGRCLCSDIALERALGTWWLLPAPPECFRTLKAFAGVHPALSQHPAPCARQAHLGSEQASPPLLHGAVSWKTSN